MIFASTRAHQRDCPGKAECDGNTALRLARYFGTSPEFWLGLQSQYDVDVEEDESGDRIEKEVKVYAEAY